MSSSPYAEIKAAAGSKCISAHLLPDGAEVVEWTISSSSHDVKVILKHAPSGGKTHSELVSIDCKASRASEAGLCLLPTPSDGHIIVEVDNTPAFLYEAIVTFQLRITSDAALADEDGHAGKVIAKSDLERNERILRDLLKRCPPGTVLSPGVTVPRPELSSGRIDAKDTVSANEAGEFGVGLFFLNRFSSSEGFFARQSDRVPLFALGQSTLSYMRAILTWSRTDIDRAISLLHSAHRVAKEASPVAGEGTGIVGGLMWLVGAADDGTSATKGEKPLARAGQEIESLLVRAETSLILAVMYLMQESAVGVLRAGLSVRSAYLFYQEARAKLKRVTSQAHLEDLQYAWADVSEAEGEAEDEDDLGDLPHAYDDIISILTGGSKHGEVPAGGGGKEHAEPSSGAGADAPSATASGAAEASGAAAEHFAKLERAVAAGESMGLSRSVASGISFGLGVFNIFASAMPPIVLRLVDLLGYPHDRKLGLRLLRRTVRADGVRSPLAALVILIAEVLIPGFLPPSARTRLKEAEHLMAYLLHMYPSSVIFLWLAGRLLRMLGRPEDAQTVFELIASKKEDDASGPKSSSGVGVSGAAGGGGSATADKKRMLEAEPLPKYLGHVVLYESGLCNLSMFRFDAASRQFEQLSKENTWSKAFYYHMRLVCALGTGDVRTAVGELAPAVEGLLERKIGGKLISAEQYAQKRARELLGAFVDDVKGESTIGLGASLWTSALRSESPYSGDAPAGVSTVHPACLLPGLELLYLWNSFGYVSKNMKLQYLSVLDSYFVHLCCGNDSDSLLLAGGIRYEGSAAGDQRKSGASEIPVFLAKPVPAAAVLGSLAYACISPYPSGRVVEAFRVMAVDEPAGATDRDRARSAFLAGVRVAKGAPLGWFDDVAVALLLRGTLLNLLGHSDDAVACLQSVVEVADFVRRDAFAVPYAHFEMACMADSSTKERETEIAAAGAFSRDFNFSLRLRFRAHLLQAFGSNE